MARRPRAPVPRSRAWSATAASASSVNSSSTSSNSKNFWYCLTSAFLGSTRISDERLLVEVGHRADDRQAADELGDQAELEEVLRAAPAAKSSPRSARSDADARRRSRCPCVPMRLSMILSMPANAPPQMNRMLVVSIWMNSWWGCLRPPCGGTEAVVPSRIFSSACCTPSPETSRVIDGFSALAGDLVDLVDVDDPGLGLLDVVVGGLDQLEQDVLDVLAHVAGLGERGGVGDGEGHVEHAGQRLGQQRLAAAGGADQQDVRLGQLDVVVVRRRRAGRACSGCRPRPTGSSSPAPGRRCSRSGTRRSHGAWGARRSAARRSRPAPPR